MCSACRAAIEESTYFLKKRSKKLSRPPLHRDTRQRSSLREAKQTKVFWFFFSKNNTKLSLCMPQ
jgi:hypothetical protein